eukprot:Awhi_evm1s14295
METVEDFWGSVAIELNLVSFSQDKLEVLNKFQSKEIEKRRRLRA